jgi:hypothetical protein
MGIILKTSRFLNSLATLDFEMRKLINPWTIQLELVSPGWSLAYTKTTFLDFCQSLSSKLVMVKRGTSTPPRDLQRIESWMYLHLLNLS